LGYKKFVGNGEQQQEKKQATGFVIKENTNQEEEQIAQCILFVDDRKNGKYNSKKHPK